MELANRMHAVQFVSVRKCESCLSVIQPVLSYSRRKSPDLFVLLLERKIVRQKRGLMISFCHSA